MDFELNPLWLGAAGAVINLAVAWATKEKGGSGVKALIALALCAVAGVAKDTIDDGGGNFESIAAEIASVFVAQLTTYLGFMSPVVNLNARIQPDKGIGSVPFVEESEAA